MDKQIIKTELILNYLKEKSISKSEFCKKCGIGLAVLEKILQNKTNFRIKSLFLIAKEMKIRIKELFIK